MSVILEINTEEGETLITLPIVNMQFKLTKEDVDDVYELTIKKEDISKIYNNFLDIYETILDNNMKTNKYKINMLELNIEKDRLKKNNIKEIKETLNNIYNINNIY